MKFYNIGSCSRPCGILKWRGLTIMLDCSLDLSPILNFVPLPLAGNSKFNNVPQYQNYQNLYEEDLSELNGHVFMNANPLFGVPTETSIDISELDVILISNSASILALPFFTENPDFNGTVYATEPTLNIGKFFMDELVEFVQNVPRTRPGMRPAERTGATDSQMETGDESGGDEDDGFGGPPNGHTTGRSPSIFKLLNSGLNFPVKLNNQAFNKDLKEIYTKKSISEALLKVRIVGYNEHTDIFGKVLVTAVSSGFSLGSCNWVLKAETKKIAYISFSSTLTTHPSQMEHAPLKECDMFILGGLNKAPTNVADQSLGEICLTTVNTLSAGGNVIFPCYPSGIVYDLFECLAAHLSANRCSQFPFYFIAPQSETSLAYSNILSEWLSVGKQRKVYIPEDPFPHTELVKTNKLRHFKALHEINDLRQPCILFCGHPSLRFGDIVHVVESFGSNSANTIIFTDADLPYVECLLPFQPLAMKAVYCPIDPSLNFHQANKLIKELKPRLLVTHEEYLVPPRNFPTRNELVIDYPVVHKISPGSVLTLKLKRKGVESTMDPKMAQDVDPTYRTGRGDTFASTITTSLQNKNNKIRLVKPMMDLCDPMKVPPSKYTWGSLVPALLMDKLNSEGLNATIQQTSTGCVINIPTERATIVIEGNSTEITCKKNDLGATRGKLRRLLVSCLIEF